jgi:hypothetical protein
MTWFFQNHKWKIRHNTKPQATSSKPHAPVFKSHKRQVIKETVPWNDMAEAHAQPEVASRKRQASSSKQSRKRQASSTKRI